METFPVVLKDKIRRQVTNRLKINDSKTEFIIVGGRQKLNKVIIEGIQIGKNRIMPASSVRNLGVIFNNKLKMDKLLFLWN